MPRLFRKLEIARMRVKDEFMLQNMRDLAKSWVFKTLMMLLIVSFGIWGIGDIFRGNPQQRAVAKVGGVPIVVQELEREFQAGMPEARKALGPDLTAQQARQMGVLDRTLNMMIEESAFQQDAHKLGLDLSDVALLDQIAAQPEFRNKDGSFNKQLWQRILQKSGFSERYFLDTEKQNEARHLLVQAIVQNVTTPKLVLNDLFHARGAKRVAEILALDDSALESDTPPDDAALQAYYQQHGSSFTAPEMRAITIAKLATDSVTKDIVVSDEDVKKAYELRTAELTLPEQRDLVQIVTQDEAKAKDLAAAAEVDGNLAAAAKAKGLTVSTLDRVDEKTILPELYTSIFALAEGQISPPVKSALGWHVVEVKKIHKGGKTTFEAAKEKLRDTLRREQSADAVARTVNELDDALAGNHPLEEIADGMKLRLVKIPSLDAQGKTPEGKEPREFPARAEVLKAAFGQAAGETSQVIDDTKGGYVVVRTDEVVPSQVRPFAEVKAKVEAAWTVEQQAKVAAVKVEDIAKALRDGKKMSSFAAESGVEIRLSKPVSALGDEDKSLPAALMPQILALQKGDVTTAVDGPRHYVVRLAEIIPVDPAKKENVPRRLVDELDDRLPLDILDQYSKFLHQRFPVTVDQDLLEMLKKQGS